MSERGRVSSTLEILANLNQGRTTIDKQNKTILPSDMKSPIIKL